MQKDIHRGHGDLRVARLSTTQSRPWRVALSILGLAVAVPAEGQKEPQTQVIESTQADRGKRPTFGIKAVVSLRVTDSTIAYALDELARQARVRIVYNNTNPVLSRRIRTNVTRFNVIEAFGVVLRGTGLTVAIAPDGETVVVQAINRRTATDSTKRSDSVTTTIRGRVIDAMTKRGIAGVQVNVPGARYAAITDSAGRFQLLDLTVGAHVVTARILGYSTASRSVSLRATGNEDVELALQFLPQRLREVVTTGAGDRQRLEVGNSSSLIKADSIVRHTPLRDISDLIKSRAPGAQVISSGGTAGAGSRIRIRGVAGLLTNSDPILIVDGVRMDATYSQRPAETQTGTGSDGSMAGNQLNRRVPAASRLNDIDPELIESIEVLKGPSAATLYGSDAANGVIVIKTKRGQTGPARWLFGTTQGLTRMNATFAESWMGWGSALDWLEPANCTLVEASRNRCTQDSVTKYNPLNVAASSPFGTGHNSNYTAQVSGGTSQIQYFLGGTLTNDLGFLKMPDSEFARLMTIRGGASLPEWAKRPNLSRSNNLTLNLSSQVNPSLDVALTTMFHSQYHRDATQGVESFIARSVGSLGYRDSIGAGWGADGPALDFLTRNSDASRRVTAGIQGNLHPATFVTVNGMAGMDQTARHDENLLRSEDLIGLEKIGFVSTRGRYDGETLVRNASLTATANLPLRDALRSRTTMGMQFQRIDNTGVLIAVENLQSGSDVLNGGSVTFSGATETRNSAATLGWFLDQSVALRELWFVTAAIRADAGSAFGRQAKPMLYPKFNTSWLISQETFFPRNPILTNVRLRGAFGQAGVQPGTEARFRSYASEPSWPDGTLITSFGIRTLGNTQLVPERSVEFEGGLDVGFWNDRLTLDLTTYYKQTRNALITRTLPTSFGFTSRQENLGEIRNRGLELSATARPLSLPTADWSVTLGMSRNSNTLVKLGTANMEAPTVNTRYVEGYPVNGVWATPILAYNDVDQDGVLSPNEIQVGDSAVYVGSMLPNAELSLHSSLSLFRGRIMLAAGFNYQGGLTQVNSMLATQCRANRCRYVIDPNASLAEQAIAASLSRTGAGGRLNDYAIQERVSWLRWNDISVTILGSPRIAHALRSRAVSVALMGRNLGVWSKYRGADPEVNTMNSGNLMGDAGGVPQTRDWSIRVNLNY